MSALTDQLEAEPQAGTSLVPAPAAPEPAADASDPLNALAVITSPSSIMAEAVRALRTRIMAQHVQIGRRALAVCGATPGVGCSFIAANLAVSLAQIGVRTALVDADLRQPSLSKLLGVHHQGPGLSEFLSDPDVYIQDLVEEPLLPCLSFIPAGSLPARPQELLASARFAALASHLLREHQVTIFDTTPANGCTDAQRVATVAGYSLVVARKNNSYVDDLATLAKLLRADGSRVVGSVLVDF
jgi:capsular exopolysaccharide synthesis family protein